MKKTEIKKYLLSNLKLLNNIYDLNLSDNKIKTTLDVWLEYLSQYIKLNQIKKIFLSFKEKELDYLYFTLGIDNKIILELISYNHQ